MPYKHEIVGALPIAPTIYSVFFWELIRIVMDNLLEKCKLSNFDESTVKIFLENHPKAVAVHPRVDKNGNTLNNGASADIRSSFGEGDEDFLGFGITIIPLSKLHESNGIYLCKDSKEGDELYSAWCKLPSTIDRQKRVLEKKRELYTCWQ